MTHRRRTRLASLVAAALVGLLLPSSSFVFAQRTTAPDHWVATWAASQTLVRGNGLGGGRAAAPPSARADDGARNLVAPPVTAPLPAVPPPSVAAAGRGPGRRFPVPPSLPGVSGQTIRMVVRASLGGRRVRVRLSNAFSGSSVVIGTACIARSHGASTIDPSSSRALTFSGKPGATMYAGQVPIRFRPEADSPDLLHPGDAGYKLMAEAIDPRIFAAPARGIR